MVSSACRGNSSATSKWDTACRGASLSSDRRSGSRRSRPIGASIVPRRDRGRPTTSARYSRVSSRRRTSSCSRRCASGERATTSSPEVSRSRRCTIPGRSGSSPPSTSYASSPCTSVPPACPRPGWTTRPAGLSTTSRCSSSYGTASSIACGSWLGRGGEGGSNSSCSPPASLWLFARARPSTRTTPSPSRRSATAREPTSARPARNWSRRRPAACSGTRSSVTNVPGTPRLALGGDQRRQQDADTDHDEAVGEVERRPVAQVEEVGDVPQPHPVEEVREAAADHEPERDRQYRVPRAGTREEDEHPRDRRRRQEDHDRGRAGEEAERDAGVLDVPDPEGPDHVDTVAEYEVVVHDPLRQLVGRRGRKRDGAEPEPLEEAGPERTLGGESRRQRVGGGAHADVPRTCRLALLLRHPRSDCRLQSMQIDAHGYASTRSDGILCPTL